MAQRIGQRLHLSPIFHRSTNGQHFFHGPFGHHLGLAHFALHHGGQAPAGKIKGDLIHLGIVFRQIGQPGVLCLGLLRFADDGQIQNSLVFIPQDVHIIFQGNTVSCQSAGFVHTQNIHAAKFLHGVDVFHHSLLFPPWPRSLWPDRP